jgi:hypothetical protein
VSLNLDSWPIYRSSAVGAESLAASQTAGDAGAPTAEVWVTNGKDTNSVAQIEKEDCDWTHNIRAAAAGGEVSGPVA